MDNAEKCLTIIVVSLIALIVFSVYQHEQTTRLFIKEGYYQTYSERGIMLWIKK